MGCISVREIQCLAAYTELWCRKGRRELVLKCGTTLSCAMAVQFVFWARWKTLENICTASSIQVALDFGAASIEIRHITQSQRAGGALIRSEMVLWCVLSAREANRKKIVYAEHVAIFVCVYFEYELLDWHAVNGTPNYTGCGRTNKICSPSKMVQARKTTAIDIVVLSVLDGRSNETASSLSTWTSSLPLSLSLFAFQFPPPMLSATQNEFTR